MSRPTGAALASLLVLSLLPAAQAAPAPARSATVAATPPQAEGTGGVAINGTAAATADVGVTVTVPPPIDADNTLRLSNDGGTTWVERPYEASTSWSLIDEAAGGQDTDGTKTVTVESGPGDGSWAAVGEASILLDRAGPIIDSSSLSWPGTGPVGIYDIDAYDLGVGYDRTEFSFDGVHWRRSAPEAFNWWPDGAFDVREGLIGGSWALGERTLQARVFDALGNVTIADSQVLEVTEIRRSVDDPPATFDLPLPAVTNEPFTIDPEFLDGYTVPSGSWCFWELKWGTPDAMFSGTPDETFGKVMFQVAPVNGQCKPWTFTLPYTPALTYAWSFGVFEDATTSTYLTFDLAGAFRAEAGGTYRGIEDSSLPLYYVIPDASWVGIGGEVRYRLFEAGGAPERDGWWDCLPSDGSPAGEGADKHGGSTFDCPVSTNEPWWARWYAWTNDEERRWGAEFDPVGDKRDPEVTSLKASFRPGFSVGSTERVTVAWTGRDKGSGLKRYTLQVSRNGGRWSTLDLPSNLSTSLDRNLAIGDTYRFRVRATDRAGNDGAWVATQVLAPRRMDDGSSALTWSSGWASTPVEGATNGTARRSETAGRTIRLTTRLDAIGLVAARGPDQGWAEIYVDGVRVGAVDLWASDPDVPRVVWQRSWATTAERSIRVRTLGTAGHPAAVVDGFVLLK